jgi:hypothetical protein
MIVWPQIWPSRGHASSAFRSTWIEVARYLKSNVIGKPTAPFDRPICGGVVRVDLGLAEIKRANLRIIRGDYLAFAEIIWHNLRRRCGDYDLHT